MPGLYIQDGGATSSALGNILGNIAAQVGPKGAAEAELLRQQTEQADLNNRLLSSQVPAAEEAAMKAPGLSAGYGMEPPGPAGSSVASTVTGYAKPPPANVPFTRGVVDTSNMSPQDALLANEILYGRGVGAVTGLAPLGQAAASGPAGSYLTRPDIAAIAKTKAAPYDTTAGQTHHVPGGALPETTTSGGDPAQLEAQKQELAAATSDATNRVNLANTARNNQNDLETARKLYNDAGAIGDNAIGSALSDETLKWISERSGFNLTRLSKGADVRAAVGNFLKGQLGSVAQQIQGDPNSPMRGVINQFNAYIPDPAHMSAEQFNWALDMIERGQDRMIEEGVPALKMKTSPHTTVDASTYTNELEALRQKRDAEARQERGNGGPGGGGPGGGAAPLGSFKNPVPLSDEAAANALPKGTYVTIKGGKPLLVQ